MNLSAQWKITGWDRADVDHFKLVQIIDLDSSTFVYGTLTNDTDHTIWGTLERKAGIYVDGEKYKLLRSVNLPIKDEAYPLWTRLDENGQKVNFVMEFEKFPIEDGFDFIENEKESTCYNIYGVHVEQIDPSKLIKTDRFLNTYTVVTTGNFAEEGKNHLYFIRDGVSVDCRCSSRAGDVFSKDDYIFYLNIINESDHGIRFDFDNNVWITGYKTKPDGKTEEKVLKKWAPESYEQYLRSEDYAEAKNATSQGLDALDWKLRSESYNSSNGDWGKIGFKMLSSLTEQVMENNIQEYLKAHPRQHPTAMKSQSIKSGDSYAGYVAAKSKNVDYFILHIKMDDYEFQFQWTN